MALSYTQLAKINATGGIENLEKQALPE